MREENLPFNQTLFLLADRYGVDCTLKAEINKTKMTSRAAKADEKDGDFSYKAKKELTEYDLQVLCSYILFLL